MGLYRFEFDFLGIMERMDKMRRGFTLLELLITIGILGVLAAGLLTSVDPFEQLKKGRDTNAQEASISLLQAFVGYYASHPVNTWNSTDPLVNQCVTELSGLLDEDGSGGAAHLNSISTCIRVLEQQGDLKKRFLDSVSPRMYLVTGNGAKLRVCYVPESRAFRGKEINNWLVQENADGTVSLTQDTDGGNSDTDCPVTGILLNSRDNCATCFQ